LTTASLNYAPWFDEFNRGGSCRSNPTRTLSRFTALAPIVSGVENVEAVLQPSAVDYRQFGQRSLEILTVFWAPISGLEQKYGGRVQIGDLISGSHHHFRAGSLERWVSLVGPEFAAPRLDHHVDPPTFCSAVNPPKLHNLAWCIRVRRQTCDYAGVGSVELQITERPPKSAEILPQYGEFQIAMFASLSAVPKIESPSTCDTPRQTYTGQPLSQFGRLPRIPCFLVWYVDSSAHLFRSTSFASELQIFSQGIGAHRSQMLASTPIA